MAETDRLARLRFAGGIVAYRDERWLPDAIASLESQRLPGNATWSGIWLVVSPGGDRTVELARTLAHDDPSLHLTVEAERRGKSAALASVLGQAQGDLLVLLNGDARAQEGAIAALCREVPPQGGSFAVMGRPVPRSVPKGILGDALALMWEIHHELHVRVLRDRSTGTHLSDELLLVPLDHLPPMRPGIINDGAFIGAWLASNGGQLRYAPDARVDIVVPETWRDHLWQRRRTALGQRQTEREYGGTPTTIGAWAAAYPTDAWRMVRGLLRDRPKGWRALFALVLVEITAIGLARWDLLRGRAIPAVWDRIGEAPPTRDTGNGAD